MLKGIDISNHQAGLNLAKCNVDFIICKATEGLGYVDPTCDGFIMQCVTLGKLWGFYHFARENDAKKEARFFYENCKGYIGAGIPVLDYETYNANTAKWCESFITEFYKLAKVYPLVYIQASRVHEFHGSWIPGKCGLWLAGYPQNYTAFTADDIPYGISPWEFAAIWQFTDCLNMAGLAMDGDLAYMDSKAWMKYAMGDADAVSSDKANAAKTGSTDYLTPFAKDVITGKYGAGNDRKEQVYNAVQDRVNRILEG